MSIPDGFGVPPFIFAPLSPLTRSLSNGWPSLERSNSVAFDTFGNTLLQFPPEMPAYSPEPQGQQPAVSSSVSAVGVRPVPPPVIPANIVPSSSSSALHHVHNGLAKPPELERVSPDQQVKVEQEEPNGSSEVAATTYKRRKIKQEPASSDDDSATFVKKRANRLAAKSYRARRKAYVFGLENENAQLKEKLKKLSQALVAVQTKVVTLTQQVTDLSGELQRQRANQQGY